MGSCVNKSAQTLLVSNPIKELRTQPPLMRLATIPLQKGPNMMVLDDQLRRLLSITHELGAPPAPGPHKSIEISHTIIRGSLSSSPQQGFEDKVTECLGLISPSDLPSLGIGIACKKGLKPIPSNQDDFLVTIDHNFRLFCVLDGHGEFGHEISDFVKKALPNYINSTVEITEQSIKEAFSHIQQDLLASTIGCELSGSTLTLAVLLDNECFLAHVGDSRAVLASRTGPTHNAVRLTTDHKPRNIKEKQRILAQGGEIKQLPGDIPFRVFLKGQEVPGLSLSRALGDRLALSVGVTSVPETTHFSVTTMSEFLILCSGGVWEFISDQEAVNTVLKFKNNPKLAAERLASLAWARWIEEEENSVDDITVIVVDLING